MKTYNLVPVLLGFIPLSLFMGFYIYFSQNLFILDDYNMIGTPFIESMKSSSLSEKLKAVFSQQNEYRFPLLALISLIQYKLFGQLNFTYYIFLGNLIVYSICFLLLFVWRKKIKISTFLPVFYLVFPLHIFIIITWANASCQYLCALGFSIFTIFLLLNEGKIKYLAFLTAFLAAFSFGSGLLALPFAIIILATKANYRLMAIWVLYSVSIYMFYFTGYIKGDGIITFALQSIQHSVLNIPKGFLWIHGGWSDLFMNEDNPLRLKVVGFFGFITFLMSGYVIYQSFWKLKESKDYLQNAFLFFVLLLLMVVISMVAIGRAGINPEISSMVSNHRYYGFLELSLIYLYFSASLTKNTQRFITFCAMVLFFSGFYKYSIAMSERAKIVVADRANHYLNPVLGTDNHFQNFQNSIDKDLSHLGAYSFPSTDLHREWKAISVKNKIGGYLKVKQILEVNKNPFITITDDSFDQQPINYLGLNGIYFVLKSDNKTFVFSTKNMFRNFKFWNSSRNKVFTNIEKELLGSGTYKVYLCLYQNNRIQYFTTNKIIKV